MGNRYSVIIWLMCCMVLLVFGFLGNRSASAAIDSYTKLLIHGDSISDTTGKTITAYGDAAVSNAGKTVTANGNAQIDTAQGKFGGTSGLFDGSGDYLTVPDSDDWNFGSGDFTIDLWVRFNSLPSVDYAAVFYSQRTDGHNESWFGLRNDGNLYFKQISGGSNTVEIIRTPSPAITTGQWYHIALIRNGNVFRIYVDGIQAGSDYTSLATLINYSGSLAIGVAYADLPTHFLDGWLDELRISKGIARWTSDFTPPTDAYTSDNCTKLLLHLNGSDGFTSFIDASRDHFKGKAISFDGSGDYLSLADSDDWNFGSGDFTIDFWVRFNSFSGNFLLTKHEGDTGYIINFSQTGISFYPVSSYWAWYAPNQNFQLNTWYHWAFVRSGNNFWIFVNGAPIGLFDATGRSINGYPGSLL